MRLTVRLPGVCLVLVACSQTIDPKDVHLSIHPPIWADPLSDLSNAELACTIVAKGNIRVHAICLERRGYHVDAIGPYGAPVDIDKLPLPPGVTPADIPVSP